VIGFIQRLLDRRRSTPRSADVVAVVDATGYDVGSLLCDELTTHGLQVKAVDAFDIAVPVTCLVLLLPGRPRRLADATHHVFTVVSALSADPATTDRFTNRIVVAWYVPHEVRALMAIPQDTSDDTHPVRAWNQAELMLGTSWQREMDRHHGDLHAAVICRSSKISTMMHASTHRYLAGKSVTNFLRNLGTLDLHFLHALSVQVADYRDDETLYSWVGAASIVAAIRIRTTHDEPRTVSGPTPRRFQ
jgi:hypothetical protein